MGQFSHYERYKRLNFSATFPLIIFQQKCKIPNFNLSKAFHLPAAKLLLPTLQMIPGIRTDMINIVLSICCLSIRMIDLFVIHSLHLSEIKLSYFKHVFNPSFFLSAIFVQTRLETSRSPSDRYRSLLSQQRPERDDRGPIHPITAITSHSSAKLR